MHKYSKLINIIISKKKRKTIIIFYKTKLFKQRGEK